jgi:hypothetical protein
MESYDTNHPPMESRFTQSMAGQAGQDDMMNEWLFLCCKDFHAQGAAALQKEETGLTGLAGLTGFRRKTAKAVRFRI